VLALLLVFYLSSDNTESNVVEDKEKPLHYSSKPKIIYLPANCTKHEGVEVPKKVITDEDAYAAIKDMVGIVHDGGTRNCEAKEYSSQNGVHTLCNIEPSPHKPCRFLSFGILDDGSFDTTLADVFHCHGVDFDPTVNHPAKPNENVWFVAMGANSLLHNPQNWILTSVPAAMKFLKWDHLDVLKMDCEGCEYALARDILIEDPEFFFKIDQVLIEFHLGKAWILNDEALVNMGKLFILLQEAGMELIFHQAAYCTQEDETQGCPEKLLELGYSCDSEQLCQSFLFAKPIVQSRK